MSTKLRIRVTRDILQKAAYCGHIKENGKWTASDHESVAVACNCAIALAVRHIFPLAIVGPDTIIPFGDTKYSSCFSEIQLPIEAQCFIREFDDLMPADRKTMTPLEFEVEIPDDVLQHAVRIEEDLALILK